MVQLRPIEQNTVEKVIQSNNRKTDPYLCGHLNGIK